MTDWHIRAVICSHYLSHPSLEMLVVALPPSPLLPQHFLITNKSWRCVFVYFTFHYNVSSPLLTLMKGLQRFPCTSWVGHMGAQVGCSIPWICFPSCKTSESSKDKEKRGRLCIKCEDRITNCRQEAEVILSFIQQPRMHCIACAPIPTLCLSAGAKQPKLNCTQPVPSMVQICPLLKILINRSV